MLNEAPKGIKLLIFDVDGTIANWTKDDLYERAKYFFSSLWDLPHKPFIALATNQSGVGLRYWMEMKGFGEPSEQPTEEQVVQRMWTLSESVRRLSGVHEVDVRMCYMHQAKSGNWSPMKENKAEWMKSNRKPAPGMLLRAMTKYSLLGDQTLMIGDQDEDSEAARRANCHFMPVSDFLFNDEWDSFDPLSVLQSY